MIKNFDSKLFLSLPLNDGNSLWSGDGCGCVKGNFVMACGGVFSFNDQNFDCLSLNGDRWGVGLLKTEISNDYPRLGLALDIAEYILLKGYPQKAKIFLFEVIERYGLLQEDNQGTKQAMRKSPLSFEQYGFLRHSLVNKVPTRLKVQDAVTV